MLASEHLPGILSLPSRVMVCVLCLSAVGTSMAGPVPPMINYQGRLIETGVGPMDGTVDLEFALYDGPSGEHDIEGELVVLSGIQQAQMAHGDIAAGTAVVTSTDGTTTYEEGTDYLLETSSGKIQRISQGSISNPEAVLVDYSYLAEELWSETQENVQVNAGIYNVLLGSVEPLTAECFDGQTVYLGVSVNGEELLPRGRIVSVGYAFKAQDAQTLEGKTANELGTVRKVEAGHGLTVDNPEGPVVTVRQEFQADPVTNAPFGLIPPDDAFAPGHIFYIDPANGDDGQDGLSHETAFRTWNRVFNSTGALKGLEGPVKVFMYPGEDTTEPINLVSAVQYDNCTIVGVHYPLITGPIACAMTVCGSNCIVAGFRVYHPNGNGIHVTPSIDGEHTGTGTIVAGNFFLDGGIGASVQVDADDVLVAYNRIGDTNFGIQIGGYALIERVNICHNTIAGGETAGIFFRKALKCVSHDNRISFASIGVKFGQHSRECRSLNDIVDTGIDGFVDDGSDNIFRTPLE